MKFLVTRTEAAVDTTKGFGSPRRIRTSEMWPIIVEANNHEDAVHQAFRECHGSDFVGHLPKTYLVVAMIDATVVSFREKKDYTVEVNPYN